MRRFAVIASILLIALGAMASADLTPEQTKEAEALIAQFAARESAARQKAVQELIRMGPDVLPLVKAVLDRTDDPEVRLRCETTLKEIMDKYGVILEGDKPVWDRRRWIEEAKKHDCDYTANADRDKAVECYRKVISAMPPSMDRMALEYRVAQLLSSVYQASKGEKARPDEAIAAYEGILKTYKPVQQRVINAMLLLGNLYKHKNDSVAAARCYETLLKVDMDKLELPPDFEATAGFPPDRALADLRRQVDELKRRAREKLVNLLLHRRVTWNDEEAAAKLVSLGPDVMPLVRKTLAETTDAEVKVRCEIVIKGITEDGPRVSEATIRVLDEAPDPAQGVRVVGRVVDQEGEAIGDVRVEAKTPSMGRSLWWAFEPSVRSDADGRFELTLPLHDILYRLSCTKMGYREAQTRVIPEAGRPVEVTFRLALAPLAHAIRGTVLDLEGQPVVNCPLELIGDYGLRAQTATFIDGSFVVDPVSGYIGQAVPLARAEGLVSTLQLVRAKDKEVVVRLALPADLAGVVREKDSGRPIADATVVIRPHFASDFRMQTTSGEDGKFLITDIPPGRYCTNAFAAGHFVHPERGHDWPEIELKSGEAGSTTIEMQRFATVEGRVIDPQGKPVPGALVCIRSLVLGDYRNEYRYVSADAQGRFCIATGHFVEKLMLDAYSPEHGLGRKSLELLRSGQRLEGVTVQLSGAMRIHGTVTDPKGRPTRDVLCLNEDIYSVMTLTGADGTFDLGRISLTGDPRHRYSVTFRAPRPPKDRVTWQPWSHDGTRYAFKSRADAPTFFHHKRVDFESGPDKDLRLQVALEPAELLEIRGTVVDDEGSPVPGAKVHLFTGDAKKETWLRTLHPTISSGMEVRVIDTVLDGTEANKDGRWTFWTVRETGVGMTRGGSHTDWSRYCVGVEGPSHLRDKLVSEVVVPDGKLRHDVTVRLDSQADEKREE